MGVAVDTAYVSEPAPLVPNSSYGAPYCTASGEVSGFLFHPDDFSLWRVQGELGAGATLEWDDAHGDEALYVTAGALDCAGQRVGEGSTLVVEAGVPAIVRCVAPAQVVHFGTVATEAPSDGILGPPATNGRAVHVVGPEHASSVHFSGDGATSVYFCDGTCPTCRVTLFLYDGSVFADGYTGTSHYHSVDEIIHVLAGELHFGPLTVPAGASIAVPGKQRYSFRTSGPFLYLNYRADVSTAVVGPRSEPVLETVDNLLRMSGVGSR